MAEVKEALAGCIKRGLDAHLKGFCSPPLAVETWGKKRGSCVVGYSESVVLLVEALEVPFVRGRLRERCLEGSHRLLAEAFSRLLDRKTGEVACFKRFGLRYHIGSIRWGSGALLEAVGRVMESGHLGVCNEQ